MKRYHVFDRIRTLRNFPMFFPPWSRYWRTNRIAKMWNGVRILMRDIGGSDYFIFLEIACDNIYRLDLIKNPKVIFDLGANIGVFSLLAAKKFPDATVYAFEPEESNFEVLVENIALSRLTNIIPIHAAVGSAAGRMELYIDETNHGGHSVIPFKTASVQNVGVVPLNIYPKPDVIKCDIEGAEYDLFKEVPDCDFVCIEIHQHPEKENLLARFREKYDCVEGEHNSFVMTRKV